MLRQTTHGKERLFVATAADRNFESSIYYVPDYRPMFKVEMKVRVTIETIHQSVQACCH